MERPSELTDAAYWDGHWRRRPKAKVISPRHGEYGRNGILLRVLRCHVHALDNSRVVELGGGSSYRLLALAKWSGAQAVAVDYSREGIDTTEAIFAANGCRVESVLADILKWRPEEKRFDLIVHWGLVEHFSDPIPLLNKCAELLAPGGTLLFSMPNMEAWGAYIWRRFCPYNWSKHVYHSDSFIKAACEAAGLELTKTFYFGYPLINIAAWESPGLLGRVCSKALSKILTAFVVLGWIFPIYHRGVRQISSERGFVAHRKQLPL